MDTCKNHATMATRRNGTCHETMDGTREGGAADASDGGQDREAEAEHVLGTGVHRAEEALGRAQRSEKRWGQGHPALAAPESRKRPLWMERSGCASAAGRHGSGQDHAEVVTPLDRACDVEVGAVRGREEAAGAGCSQGGVSYAEDGAVRGVFKSPRSGHGGP